MDVISGFLSVDKPQRLSSAQVVSLVRTRTGGAKCGHAGTLDPLATGVLVLGLGAATKHLGEIVMSTKRYRTEVDLSAFTSTDDAEGDRCEVACDAPADRRRVECVLAEQFRGPIMQVPPVYSAVKVGGRRAYALARRGSTPELTPRTVVVHEITLMRYDWPIVELDIMCGKGFYVRSLARDLGQALGTGGHCASIRRTAVGPFTIEQSRSMDEIPHRITQSDVLPMEWLASALGDHETAG